MTPLPSETPTQEHRSCCCGCGAAAYCCCFPKQISTRRQVAVVVSLTLLPCTVRSHGWTRLVWQYRLTLPNMLQGFCDLLGVSHRDGEGWERERDRWQVWCAWPTQPAIIACRYGAVNKFIWQIGVRRSLRGKESSIGQLIDFNKDFQVKTMQKYLQLVGASLWLCVHFERYLFRYRIATLDPGWKMMMKVANREQVCLRSLSLENANNF